MWDSRRRDGLGRATWFRVDPHAPLSKHAITGEPLDPAAMALAREALAKGGLADMRPTYRSLLRLLKERDPGAFSEATARYDEVLVPAITGGEDPLATWIEYGIWVAARLAPGRLVQLDDSGLATDVTGSPGPDSTRVLLYLPEAEKESAVAISRPEEPSPAQRSALQLLVR